MFKKTGFWTKTIRPSVWDMLLLCWTFPQILKILHSVKEGTGLFHFQKCIFFIYSPVQLHLLTTWIMIVGYFWALFPLSLIFQLPIPGLAAFEWHMAWLPHDSHGPPVSSLLWTQGSASSRFHAIFRAYLLAFKQSCSLSINSIYHNWKKKALTCRHRLCNRFIKVYPRDQKPRIFALCSLYMILWAPFSGWIHLSLSKWFC